ncbi:MAG: flagellar basal body P-ring protein FlgI, partial [Planctomycetes bacterium]|nr:flagellar basal body P-ring protein FlgI [Planctomycetota bacterium]
YGLVVDLGDRGSSDCPRAVRDKLLKELHRRPEFHRAGSKDNPITPTMMIEDPDTAVVLVQGEIPAGAPSGTSFDLSVSAIPGTQTTSLRSGYLYHCDLTVYRMLSAEAGIPGKVLARAEGPVFLNPFSDKPDAATRSNERSGMILGGGMVTTDRRLRLVLARPSYGTARALAAAINNRFPGRTKTADPISPSYIPLTLPREYYSDPLHFLGLVQHLYTTHRPGFADQRIRALTEEIVRPAALYEDIALAWEGLGRRVIPEISKLFTHHHPSVRFYAARTALRLGDDVAVEVMADLVADDRSPHRFDAITALGQADDQPRAAGPLLALLDDDDPTLRTAAYEALLECGHPAIATTRIGRGNFSLDLVPSRGENLIYAKRTGSRRIAVFGSPVRFLPPLFYRHPNGEITVNADETDAEMTVLYQDRRSDRLAPPVRLDFDVPKFVALMGSPLPRHSEAPLGLGRDYGTIIHLLYDMAELRALNARVIMERPSVGRLFGPRQPTGRRESELD